MVTGNVLEVIDVSKRFGGVYAVDRVKLTLRPHEILGLVGANGAGKSTLIGMISGATVPETGHLKVEDRKVELQTPMEARNSGIETVYQDLALLKDLDVTANIFMGRELCRRTLGLNWLREEAMRVKAGELVRELKYDFDVRQAVKTLSGGQRQAVALARALYFQAKVILMDEPTAALGVEETQRTLDLIREFKQRGVSLIVVSHEMEEIFALADRIMVMKGGRVVGERVTVETSHQEIVELILRGDKTSRKPPDPR